ncbi:MAG: ribonuclease PH [Acidobacteriota bacterium]
MTESSSVRRAAGRTADALRPVIIHPSPLKYPEGSALIEVGDTRVLVAATLESRVPSFLAGSGRGWLTAEYAMLPRATSTRSQREVSQGRPSGRSAEIQRLIGRSLRAAIDLSALPDRTLTIDCDVLQADGGTRTASITGAYVAAALAFARAYLSGDLARWPLTAQVAAISAGLVNGVPLLDLDAPEDQSADADMNVIATVDGRLIEIQATGEKRPFERREMDTLLDLALAGIRQLGALQESVLGPTLAEVCEVQAKGRRKPAAPKDEKDLWGKPS